MPQPLTDPQVTVEDTTFTIRKLLPMEGYRLLEVIRPALKSVTELDLTGLTGDDVAAAVAVVAGVPQPTVETCRQWLFKHVLFTNGSVPQPTVLAGNEDTAFQNLTAAHVYEILVRAFVVNFRESWTAAASRLPTPNLGSLQSNPSTSPLSSPTQ